MIYNFENSIEFARKMDKEDVLNHFRSKFHLPVQENGQPYIYLCGNSLGLQPKSTKESRKDLATMNGNFEFKTRSVSNAESFWLSAQ